MNTLTVHATTQHRNSTPAPSANARTETFGWTCSASGCTAGPAGYLDQSTSHINAVDHERQRTEARFAPGTLVVAVGAAGSGKSTFAAAAGIDVVICLDTLRREIGGEGNQSVTRLAVARQNALLDTHLSAGDTVFLDSTNVEAHVRADLVERARRHRRRIVAVRFMTDLDTCHVRNRRRPTTQRVPDHILAWQHSLAQETTEQALLAEGFTAVHQASPD